MRRPGALLLTGRVWIAASLVAATSIFSACSEKVPGTQFYDAAEFGFNIARQSWDALLNQKGLGNRQPLGIVETCIYCLRNMAIALGLAAKVHLRSNVLREVIHLQARLSEKEQPEAGVQASLALLKQLLEPELRLELAALSLEVQLPPAPGESSQPESRNRSWTAQMPQLGLGTGIFYVPKNTVAEVVSAAARDHGYRHFDCAQNYGTEEAVGKGLQRSGIPREELFISTKISNPQDFGSDATPRLVKSQLSRLGVEYVDLYMFHGQLVEPWQERAAWKALEKLRAKGYVRSLGLSNYDRDGIRRISAYAKVPPSYLQIKYDVYHHGYQLAQEKQDDLVTWAQAQNITVVGYSTLSGWPFLLGAAQDPHVKAVAAKYGVQPGQLLLRHSLQKGLAVIPSSANAGHLQDNANIFNFEILHGDIALLDGLAHFASFALGEPSWVPDVYGVGSALRDPDELGLEDLDSDDEDDEEQETNPVIEEL